MFTNRVKSTEYHFTVEFISVVNGRGICGPCEIHHLLPWFPFVLLLNKNYVLRAPPPTAAWSTRELLWPFSTLLHQSQNSHCLVLMQNAITFSIRTSLSQEVNGKHISHCVPAALILLMAKTPWRQIDLSLFRKLWVERKYIRHLYNMRALSIWCIKEGRRRGGVHVTSCLLWLEARLEGVFSCLHFLSVALINSSSSGRGEWDLTFRGTNSGKEDSWISIVEGCVGSFLQCGQKRYKITQLPLFLILLSYPTSLCLWCASSAETVDQYICEREPRQKTKQNIIIMLRFLLRNYLKVDWVFSVVI